MFKVETSIMVNMFAILVVLVTLVTVVTADEIFVNCREPEHHLQQCAFGSICAWNKCNCGQGKKHCQLVCQKSMRQWCNGLSEGDNCIASAPQYECSGVGKKLMCVLNPIGPVCLDEGKLYFIGETFIPSSGTICQCGKDGQIGCSGSS